MTNPIRWLHLSDFHVGKDIAPQLRLLEKTVEYVQSLVAKGFVPDIIFLTGDIANKGLKGEYQAFRSDFYNPLLKALGDNDWQGKVLAVPGNHDLDRTKNSAIDRAKFLVSGNHAFDYTEEGRNAREILFPRFKSYRQLAPANISGNWIDSLDGAYTDVNEIRGQHIGVAGINTAWLSMDEHDKEKLSPGFNLVEAAINKIKDFPIRVVLGHHPLNWFSESESRRLRALFGHYQVIYLHGHLHKAEVIREDGAGNQFLTFQAGASFQARDDEPWRNGLTIGEFDLSRGVVRVSPRFWNPDDYNWTVEDGRFPEKFRDGDSIWWAYPLPGFTGSVSNFTNTSALLPNGWEHLNQASLEAYRREITPEEAAAFFDGAEPEWDIALCTKLPRREVVGRLIERISAYHGQERPLVVLTLGPGGEGKSMALRQTVVGLTEQIKGLQVLWHRDCLAPISGEQLLALPQGEHPWLVATDSADMIATSLHSAIEAVARAGRHDIRFLLMAREGDWRLAGAAKLNWGMHTTLKSELLSGLTKEDAVAITHAWEAFGQIEGSESVEISQRFFDAAKQGAAVGEGALLGGVLAMRESDSLSHVRAMLNRLTAVNLKSGGTLYTAFTYIAAMHAKKLDFLSRPVLAEALGCDPGYLQQHVIFPLGKEAAAGGGTLLLTRHRRIAIAAMKVMQEELGEDIDGLYVTLAVAAMRAFHNRIRVPELHRWNFELPEHFLSSNSDLAIRIGQAVLDQDPNNSKLVVSLAHLYRETGYPASGATLLKDFVSDKSDNRGFWYEWGTCAGEAHDYSLNAWLAGWSLADDSASVSIENNSAKRSLAGLGMAFGKLFEQSKSQTFIEARGAVAVLGFRLQLDPVANSYFAQHRQETEAAGIGKVDVGTAMLRLQEGLIKAWEACPEKASLADRIPAPQTMKFNELRQLCMQTRG